MSTKLVCDLCMREVGSCERIYRAVIRIGPQNKDAAIVKIEDICESCFKKFELDSIIRHWQRLADEDKEDYGDVPTTGHFLDELKDS